jgi:hypothetical protein
MMLKSNRIIKTLFVFLTIYPAQVLFCLWAGIAAAQVTPQAPNLFFATPSTGTGYLELRAITPLDFNSGTGASGSTCLSGLLTWIACSGGGGGVNSGTAGQLAYYAANGAVVSGAGYTTVIPVVASASSGLAPASGGGTTNFLRADGTWTVPSGVSNPLNVQGVRKNLYADSYGVKCDGATDDTTALQNFLNAITTNTLAILPPGQCIFKSQLTVANADYLKIEGAMTRLTYAGSSTTTNLIVLGTSTNSCGFNQLVIEDLILDSNTTMTGGNGLTINWACNATIRNVGAGDLNVRNTLYNAVVLAGGNNVTYDGCPGIEAEYNGLLVYGGTSAYFTGPTLLGSCYILGAVNGLNIAGGVGGITDNDWDILENNTNVNINESVRSLPNEQIFFGATAAIDVTSGSPNIDVYNTDPGSANSLLMFSGTWVASAGTVCLDMPSGQWYVNFTGGMLWNCGTQGYYQDSANITANFVGVGMSHNGNYAIDNGAGVVNKCGIQFTYLGYTNGSGNTAGTVGSSC